MLPTIRSARPSDVPALCRLYQEFHEYVTQALPDRLRSLGPWEVFNSEKLAADIQAILARQDAALLVAEVGGQCVGLAEVYLREEEPGSLRLPQRYALLQSLAVTAPLRGQGIGTLVLQAAQEWARRQGAEELQLETWEFEGGPVAFYERRGYRTFKRRQALKL